MAALDLQMFMFLVAVLIGMATGLLFDLLRLWRRLCRPGRVAGHVGDAAFAAVATLVVAAGLLFINWVQIRVFVVLGLAAGAGLYLHLASPLVLRFLLRLVALMARSAGWTLRVSRMAARRVAGVFSPMRRLATRVLRPPARRLRRWGRDGLRRLASLWRRFPGFLA